MSIADYYFSDKLIDGMGRMYFLKVLQRAETAGGGEALLGSVVQELTDGGIFGLFGTHYPVPMQLTKPKIVRDFMEGHRAALGLAPTEPVVLQQILAGGQRTVTINGKDGGGVGVGPFPAVPVGLTLDIDYTKMQSVELSFGDAARIEYIPLGYFGRLFQYVAGSADAVEPGGTLKDNYVVDSLLVANNFKVSFHSTDSFSADFKAKVQSLPVQANVTFHLDDDTVVSAQVSGADAYLVALGVSLWGDFADYRP
jgi:hypothetical protein